MVKNMDTIYNLQDKNWYLEGKIGKSQKGLCEVNQLCATVAGLGMNNRLRPVFETENKTQLAFNTNGNKDA